MLVIVVPARIANPSTVPIGTTACAPAVAVMSANASGPSATAPNAAEVRLRIATSHLLEGNLRRKCAFVRATKRMQFIVEIYARYPRGRQGALSWEP